MRLDSPRPAARYNTSFASSTVLAANTAQTVLAAASNVNGVFVEMASFFSYSTGGIHAALVAKATAPVSTVDGAVILGPDSATFVSGGYSANGRLPYRAFVPPGLGLFFIASAAETLAYRSALLWVL